MTSPEPPEQIDRFRVESRLGGGQFGDVYLAFDPELYRRVAIKVSKSLDASDTPARFRQEARRIASLNHSKIVRVYECGEFTKDRPYLVTDYVKGSDLRVHLKKADGRLDPIDAFAFALDIATALAHVTRGDSSIGTSNRRTSSSAKRTRLC